MNELRIIPRKNYIILGLVLLVTVILVLYFNTWYLEYKDTKVNSFILDKYMTMINLNEIDDYLVENPNAILYISSISDEEIRNFEKKLRKKYISGEINLDCLYLDISSNNIDDLSKKIGYINNVPVIVYYKDGIIDSRYSIIENDYDIDKFIRYIDNYNNGDVIYD